MRENRAVLLATVTVIMGGFAGALYGLELYVLSGFVLSVAFLGLALLWPWKVDLS